MTDPRDTKAREIGRRIALARKESGMTQNHLAFQLRVSPRSVAAYEAGELIPYRHMRDLEQQLERPMGWLLHGDKWEGQETLEMKQQLDQVLAELKKLNSAVSSLRRSVEALAQPQGGRPGKR
jgi:transcriptional regulator with XRE-family HTH domain